MIVGFAARRVDDFTRTVAISSLLAIRRENTLELHSFSKHTIIAFRHSRTEERNELHDERKHGKYSTHDSTVLNCGYELLQLTISL